MDGAGCEGPPKDIVMKEMKIHTPLSVSQPEDGKHTNENAKYCPFIHKPLSVHPFICPSCKHGLSVYYVPSTTSKVDTKKTKTLSSSSRPHSTVDRDSYSLELDESDVRA